MICRKAISALVPQDSKQVKWPSKLQLKAFLLQHKIQVIFLLFHLVNNIQVKMDNEVIYTTEDNLKTLDKTQY